MNKILRKKIAIIGAGPIGLISSLFLQKFGVDFCLIERKIDKQSHPAAHLINLRSMEILTELGLNEQIYNKIEDINYFRYYRYMKKILNTTDPHNVFAVHDHFLPNIDEKQKEINQYAFSKYIHLPQHIFGQILYDKLINSTNPENLMYGTEIQKFDNTTNKEFVHISARNIESGEQYEIKADLILACDGFKSQTRNQLGIKLIGNPSLQNFLNIYFHSPSLAKKIDQTDQNAMLHFIYNKEINACLVNHTKSDGCFVLQVPVHLPYSEFMLKSKSQDELALQTINQIIDQQNQLSRQEVEIKNVGIWALSTQLIESYYKNNVLFAGDSAHSFPPAGGFGMNTGIQDIHNLMHKLKIIFSDNISSDKNKQQTIKEKLLKDYSNERKIFANHITNTAMTHFKTSLEIPQRLGLSYENLKTFKHGVDTINKILPNNISKQIFDFGINQAQRIFDQKEHQEAKKHFENTDNLIPMIFYKEDTMFSYEGHGDVSKNIKFSKNAGKLFPHLYFKLNLKNKETILSTREIPILIQNNPDQMKPYIILGETNGNIFSHNYMIALFQSEDQEEQNKLIEKLKLIIEDKEFNHKPDMIYGFGLSLKEISQHNAQFQIERFQQFFKNQNSLILVRSDSIIYLSI